MAGKDFPYRGTKAELDTIDRELEEVRLEREQLDIQIDVLLDHRNCVLKLLGATPLKPVS